MMGIGGLISRAARSIFMAKLALLVMGCYFSIVAAAIPPIPEMPDFPAIKSGNNTYHVHNELGSDIKNDGSAGRPWRTFEFAAGRLRAGDTLIAHGTKTAYLMSGATLVHSGDDSHWIAIEGKDGVNGERVVLQERLSFGSARTPVGYVYLKNILFQGPGGSGLNIKIYSGSHHLAFENIEIDCQSHPKNKRGLWTDDRVRYVWFKDMNIHHCGYKRNALTTPPPPDWKSPTDCGGLCVKGSYIDEVVFLNVRTADNVGDGMGGGSKVAYGNSYFKNCISERNTGDGLDIGGIRTVIMNSISRNNGGHQGTGFKFWAKESWLVNSVAYRNDNNGVAVKPRHGGDHHVYILNSTFALNSSDRYGGQIGTTPKLPASGKLFFHVHNNIFYTLNSSAIVINNVETQIVKEESHNYYFSVYDSRRHPHWTYKHAIHFRDGKMKVARGYSFTEMADKGKWSIDTGNGAGNIGETSRARKLDPGFLGLDGGDLHLTKGSLAIDGGIDVGIRSDIDGVPVPIGSAPDMGAYEFTAHDVNSIPALEDR